MSAKRTPGLDVTDHYAKDKPWLSRGPGWDRSTNWAAARDLRLRQTPAETALWALIRNHALGVRFRRQHPIGPFVVDFFCPKTGLIIELDGDIHDEPDVQEQDRWRQDWLVQHGYIVVRIENEVVLHRPAEAVETIRRALDAHE